MEREYFDVKEAIEAINAAETLDCFYTLEKKEIVGKNVFGNNVYDYVWVMKITNEGDSDEG